MSEIDDLADIVNLLPERSGSVNRTPSSINAGQRLWRRIHARPKWRKQTGDDARVGRAAQEGVVMNRRHEFTTDTKRRAYARARAICECHRLPRWPFPVCGLPLGIGNTFYDHIDPDFLSKDNSLENCAVLTKTCHALKTDYIDKHTIAKTKRVRDRARGIGRTLTGRPLPGTRASGMKHLMNGGWVRR